MGKMCVEIGIPIFWTGIPACRNGLDAISAINVLQNNGLLRSSCDGCGHEQEGFKVAKKICLRGYV
jgi:hypothetical protein